MENQRIIFVVLSMVVSCCFGTKSTTTSVTQYGSVSDSSRVIQLSEEYSLLELERGINFCFTLMRDIGTKLSDEADNVCQHDFYNIMMTRDKASGALTMGLDNVINAYIATRPKTQASSLDSMARSIVRSEITNFINNVTDSIMEVSNLQGNRRDFVVEAKIAERRNATRSACITAITATFLPIQRNAVQPGMEAVIENAITKAAAECIKVLGFVYDGIEILTGFSSEHGDRREDCCCKLEETRQKSMLPLRSQTKYMYGVLQMITSSDSSSKNELLQNFFDLDSVQKMLSVSLRSGIDNIFDAMESEITKTSCNEKNSSDCKSSTIDIAEDKTIADFQKADLLYLNIVSSLFGESSSTSSMTCQSSGFTNLSEQIVKNIFAVLRLNQTANCTASQPTIVHRRNDSLAAAKTSVEQSYAMVIKNGQKFPEKIQRAFDASKANATKQYQFAINEIFNGLEAFHCRGSQNGSDVVLSEIQLSTTRAYLDVVSLFQYMTNNLRILALYNVFGLSEQTDILLEIQENQDKTYFEYSTEFNQVFNMIAEIQEQINAAVRTGKEVHLQCNNSSTAQAMNMKLSNAVLSTAQIPLNSIVESKPDASANVEVARPEVRDAAKNLLAAVNNAIQLYCCQNCTNVLDNLTAILEDAKSYSSRFINSTFEPLVCDSPSNSQIGIKIEQQRNHANKAILNEATTGFAGIKALLGQIYPSSRIGNKLSRLLVENSRYSFLLNKKKEVKSEYNAVQDYFVYQLTSTRQSRYLHCINEIQTQREIAYDGMSEGISTLFDMFKNDASNSQSNDTIIIDRAQNRTYICIKRAVDAMQEAVTRVFHKASSAVKTVRIPTYVAIRSVTSSIYAIVQLILQRMFSGIYREIVIMQRTVICLSEVIVKNLFIPMRIDQESHKSTRELNNAEFSAGNHSEAAFETMFAVFEDYTKNLRPEKKPRFKYDSSSIEVAKSRVIVDFKAMCDVVLNFIVNCLMNEFMDNTALV